MPRGERKSLVNKGSTPLLKNDEGGKVEKGGDAGEGRSAAKDGSTLVSFVKTSLILIS